MSVLLLTTGDPNNLLLTTSDNLLLHTFDTLTVDGPGATTVSVEFSPTTGPLDTPSWVEITRYVRVQDGVTINRGRSSELDDFNAGTATFTLDNRTRLFDPTYTAGAYYGNLLPLRRFRIRAAYNGTIRTLFVGFIRAWPQEYDGQADREATVPVRLVDAFGLLSLANMSDNLFTLDSSSLGVLDVNRLGGTSTIAEESSGTRVDRVRDLVGWPASEWSIDTGLSTVSGVQPTGGALAYLKQVERSEDGFFYVTKDGTIRFWDRNTRQTETRMTTANAVFDDDGTDSRYSTVSFSYDDENLFNDVRLTGASGTEQAVEDSTSIGSYFRRSYTATLLTVGDGMVRDLAAIRLDRYKDPIVRVPEIEIRPLRDQATLFPVVLDTELLDRVTVRRTPQNVGTVIAQDVLVEGITHRFTSTSWATRLRLSPGFITDYFTLDSATLGVLDEDRLGG